MERETILSNIYEFSPFFFQLIDNLSQKKKKTFFHVAATAIRFVNIRSSPVNIAAHATKD